MDATEVAAWTASYYETTVDLGAGDGRFVRHLARQHPKAGAIGVDLCEANLRIASRAAAGDALFVVADASALPDELSRVATRVTVNFSRGSLLRGWLTGHPGSLVRLGAVGSGGATLDIRSNARGRKRSGDGGAARRQRRRRCDVAPRPGGAPPVADDLGAAIGVRARSAAIRIDATLA